MRSPSRIQYDEHNIRAWFREILVERDSLLNGRLGAGGERAHDGEQKDWDTEDDHPHNTGVWVLS